ncbi:ABC transporter ATP-binding protein [Oryzobacter sp. R7]|uniref:ABC transporter ATP-binding protein n=1 Tax=Oryzobacter faecalis TaxID=3388656 RepID=UPI00398D2EE9
MPPGLGALFSPSTRRRLALAAAGSVGLSLLDTIGVLATLPLFQVVAGVPVDEGALGTVSRVTGVTGQRSLVLLVCGFVIAVFVTKSVLAFLFRRWQVHFLADQQAVTSASVLRRYLSAPYAFHLRRTPAELLRTVNDGIAMTYTGVVAGLQVLVELSNIVFVMAALVVVAPWPALFTLVYFGTAGYLLQRLTRRRLRAAGARVIEAATDAYRLALQSLNAVKEIRLRDAAGTFSDRYLDARRRSAHAGAAGAVWSEFPKYFFDVIFVTGVGLLAAGLFATGGEDALVTLGLFVAAGSRLLPSLVRLLGSVGTTRVADQPMRLVIDELRDLEAAERELGSRARAEGPVPAGDLRVEDLWYRYPGSDVDVLRGVDLTVPVGTSLAVVGSSGAGKSTFVDLLLGLHEPTRGRITAGGRDVMDNLVGWQSTLAVVPQDVYLADASLAANIAFGERPEDVDDALVLECVRRANLEHVVAELPEGLHSWVGERGVRLSGGQRQRVGIARALYRRPRLLVLDEATSALDNKTERSVTETIGSLSGDITVVVVAHRLSTVRHADRLVYLDGGVVRAQGSFDEVRRQNADFAELVALAALEPDDVEGARDAAP